MKTSSSAVAKNASSGGSSDVAPMDVDSESRGPATRSAAMKRTATLVDDDDDDDIAVVAVGVSKDRSEGKDKGKDKGKAVQPARMITRSSTLTDDEDEVQSICAASAPSLASSSVPRCGGCKKHIQGASSRDSSHALFYALDVCSHRFCTECLANLLANRIRDSTLGQVQCGLNGCAAFLTPRDIRHIILSAPSDATLSSLRLKWLERFLSFPSSQPQCPFCSAPMTADPLPPHARSLMDVAVPKLVVACKLCDETFCMGCFETVSLAPDSPLVASGKHHCPAVMASFMRHLLAQLEPHVVAGEAKPAPAKRTAARSSKSKLKSAASGTGYDGSEMFADAKAATATYAERQSEDDKAVTEVIDSIVSLLKRVSVLDPSLRPLSSSSSSSSKSKGKRADSSDDVSITGSSPSQVFQQPVPAILAPLMLRSCLAPFLTSTLRNDSMMDVSDRSQLYFAVFTLIQTLLTNQDLIEIACEDLQAYTDEFLARAKQGTATSTGASSKAQLSKSGTIVEAPMAGAAPSAPSASIASLLKGLDAQAKYFIASIAKGTLSEEDEEAAEMTAILSICAQIKDMCEDVRRAVEIFEKSNAELAGFARAETVTDSDAAPVEGVDKTAAARPSGHEAKKVKVAAATAQAQDAGATGLPSSSKTPVLSAAALSERYVRTMSDLKFDTVEGLADAHSYTASATKGQSKTTFTRTGRIFKEITSLPASLPVTWESSVFVRVDDNRNDILRAMIIGPKDTPYANGIFFFDIWLPAEYPTVPPHVKFLTTGQGGVRFNPNLYNCGKVCLSLLNTWEGPKWTASCTLLQVLISIQSLVMVAEPYYNEPGYSKNVAASKQYNMDLYAHTVNWAMLQPLKATYKGFDKIVRRHFFLKRDEIKAQLATWDAELKAAKKPAPVGLGRIFGMGQPASNATLSPFQESVASLLDSLSEGCLSD